MRKQANRRDAATLAKRRTKSRKVAYDHANTCDSNLPKIIPRQKVSIELQTINIIRETPKLCYEKTLKFPFVATAKKNGDFLLRPSLQEWLKYPSRWVSLIYTYFKYRSFSSFPWLWTFLHAFFFHFYSRVLFANGGDNDAVS